MRRIPTSLIALATVVALALAGCGGGGDEETTTATSGGSSSQQRDAGGQEQQDSGGGGGQHQGAADEQGGDSSDGKTTQDQDTSNLPPPEEGSKAAAPGVPTTSGGDNSIQVYGLEASADERAQVTAIVQGFLDARATDNWAKACSYLVADQRAQFEQLAQGTARLRDGGCAAAMEALTSAAPRSVRVAEANIEVLSLRVGENAFLIYRGVGDKAYATALTRENGEWKIISIAPTPLQF